MWTTSLRFFGILILLLVATQLGVQLLRLISRCFADRKVKRQRIEQLRLEVDQLRAAIQGTRKSVRDWEGWRKFRVQHKVAECRDINSFYLVPHDAKPLPTFLPGQYLTIRLRIPGNDKPVVRCYSLSSAPNPEYFRCTIKKVDAPEKTVGVPPGTASTFFHDRVGEGDLIDVRAPRGSFHVDESDQGPVVLLAAGVGITPLLSMLEELASRRASAEVYLFFSVRNSTQHLFKQQLDEIARTYPQVRLTTCYSRPLEADVQRRDYDVKGHLDLDLLKDRLPSSNFVFYLCGPTSFMASLVSNLQDWGVTSSAIRTESFGPSSVKKTDARKPNAVVEAPSQLEDKPSRNGSAKVTFDRSRKECWWDETDASLLELAESAGVAMDAGCRSGNCGTCAIAVKTGTVDYAEPPEFDCEEGTCLPCVAVPKGTVVLDA